MVQIESPLTCISLFLMNQANLKSTNIDVLEHFVDLGFISNAQRMQIKTSNVGNLRSLIDNGFQSKSSIQPAIGRG